MKSMLTIFAMTMLLAGCATIRQSKIFHGVKVEDGEVPLETVEIENSGWKLFKFIPLGSGDSRYPNKFGCRFFQDTVTLQNNLNMLEKEMGNTGATRFTNLTSRNSEETFLFIVLTRNAYHTSAVLLKNTPATDETVAKKGEK